MNEQRKPDYVLKIRTVKGKEGRVGAGWKNEKGYINIILDPGVVIDDERLVMITLFPKDYKV